MRVGIVLIGIWMAVSTLPTLLRALGLAIYYAEESRQQFAAARFDTMWPDLIQEGLRLVAGAALVLLAAPITKRFEVSS